MTTMFCETERREVAGLGRVFGRHLRAALGQARVSFSWEVTEMRSLTVLLALVVALFVSVPAFATVLFDDNFESGTHGDPLGAANPGPGTWALSGQVPDNSLYLKISTAGGGLPASAYGAVYGATIRGIPEVQNGGYDYAEAPFAAQSNASSQVQFQADIYGQDGNGPNNTPVDLKIALMSGTTECNSVVIEGGSSTATSSVSVGGVATGLTWGLDAWHHLTMSYNPTASTFSLAIDAQTPLTGLAMTTPSAIDGVRFVQTSAGMDRWSVFDNVQVSVSSVPEPSSIALLVSALMAFAAYARRKRR